MKRIRVSCGICQGTKYYSVQRGITKVSSIIACENCRHFYHKLKRNPFSLDCISPIKGSCYKECSFMKTRCKGCWAMQLLDSCPHPITFYTLLSGYISEECRKQMRGTPLKLGDVEDDALGKVVLEEYENDEWKELASSEEDVTKLTVSHEEDISESPATDSRRDSRTNSLEDHEKDNDAEEEGHGRSRGSKDGEDQLSSMTMTGLTLDNDEDMIDLEEEEALIDDPDPVMIQEVSLPTSGRGKMSERIKRRRKKVEYFTKPITGRKTKGPIYGSDGRISKTGMDLCDCLQPDCVGCHFPCPKCRSPKCGNECRVNRRWYYERVEVEGTKMFWVNRFVPKM